MLKTMVKEAITRINKVGSRHTIYLRKDLVEDSQFPFRPGEPLIVRINGDKLVIERLKTPKNTNKK